MQRRPFCSNLFHKVAEKIRMGIILISFHSLDKGTKGCRFGDNGSIISDSLPMVVFGDCIRFLDGQTLRVDLGLAIMINIFYLRVCVCSSMCLPPPPQKNPFC